MSIQNYRTPQKIFDVLNALYGPFTLDAAADEFNTKCKEWYDIKQNGLLRPWHPFTFCNPPFKSFGDWIRKAMREYKEKKNCSVVIGPVGCSQSWFSEVIVNPHTGIFCPTKRINFDSPSGGRTGSADRDSMIYVTGYGDHGISSIDFYL
jgi:phage N-6-adenine-methyltransferase